MKLAHISDLHCFSFNFSPWQFFSKRWIGNFHGFFLRRFDHDKAFIEAFANHLQKENYTHLIISGDVTTSGHRQELLQAKSYIDDLSKIVPNTYLIPGNHDSYIKFDERSKIFFKIFSSYFQDSLGSLSQKKVARQTLSEDIDLVLIDASIACPFYLSQGLYTMSHDIELNRILEKNNPKKLTLVVNHFPLFQCDTKNRSLLGSRLLVDTLKSFEGTTLYLSGHTHRSSLADLRKSSLPILADSGSLSMRKRPTFTAIEFNKERLSLKTLQIDKTSAVQIINTLEATL